MTWLQSYNTVVSSRKGKLTAYLSIAAGAAVIAASGILFKDSLIEQWHLLRLASSSDPVRTAAIRKLAAMKSPRAVPALLEILANSLRRDRLDEPPPASSSEAFDALQELGPEELPALIGCLTSKDETVRSISAWFLIRHGSAAAEATPILLGRLKEAEEVSFDEIIPSVVIRATQPKLADLIPIQPEYFFTLCAIQTLSRMGPAAIPAVLEASGDPDPRLRSVSARIAGMLAIRHPEAFDALADRLQKGNAPARAWALSGLAWVQAMGPQSRDTKERLRDLLPAIGKAMEDEDAAVRGRAAVLRVLIEGPAGPIEPALIEPLKLALVDEERLTRYRAAWFLSTLGGPEAEAAIPVLEGALGDPSREIQEATKEALQRLRSR